MNEAPEVELCETRVQRDTYEKGQLSSNAMRSQYHELSDYCVRE